MRRSKRIAVLPVVALLAWAPAASAICYPQNVAESRDPVNVTVRLLVIDDGVAPYVLARCGASGGPVFNWRVPLNTLDVALVQEDVELAHWNQIWEQTAPRYIVRQPPSAADHAELARVVDPEPAEVLTGPDGPTVNATFSQLEGTSDVAQMWELVPDSPSADFHWLPTFRVPLVQDPEGRWQLPLVLDGSEQAISADVLILSQDRYVGLSGMDIWEAVVREPGGLDAQMSAVAPNPALLIPDIRMVYNPEVAGGFEAFYERRVGDVMGESEGFVSILRYVGPIGEGEAPPQPTAFSPQPSANRAVRVQLRGGTGAPLTLSEIRPAWYRPVFVQLPDLRQIQPTRPEDLSIDSEALLFRFGAEIPAELSAGVVSDAINQNFEALAACDLATETVIADIQLLVESGGVATAVFVNDTPDDVGHCITHALSIAEFPLATGPPISIRFPIAFEHN